MVIEEHGAVVFAPKVSPLGKVKGRKRQSQRDLSTQNSFHALINEARFIEGDASDLVPLDQIPWIDQSLINEALAFHRKFLALVILSNTSALMIGFAVKPNTAVLLKTGKLHDPELSFQRYLSTVQRIGQFFTLPFNNEVAYKAFQTVRKMHALARKVGQDSNPSVEQLGLTEPWKTELVLAIRKDLKYFETTEAPHHALIWNPPVPVSQFDMAVTQFGFWGTIWMFPYLFGVKDRDREMKGVIHMWAIFGKLLGIRDEYNICLRQDPLLYEMLFRNVIVASLQNMDETVVTIQNAFMEAFTKRMPVVTYRAFLFLNLQQLKGFQGGNLWKLMSWKDKASLMFQKVFLWLMRNFGVFRILINLVFGLWLQVQFWIHLPKKRWPNPQFLFQKIK